MGILLKSIPLAGLALFCLFGAAEVHAATLGKPPNNLGLVGYWNFNEATSTITSDFSGRGNSGTLSGTTKPSWTSGKFASGLSFDGSTSYVSVGNPYSSNSNFTISVWVKPSAINTGSYQGFIGRQSGAGSWTYRAPGMWVAPSSGQLHYDSYSTAGVRASGLISNYFTAANEWVLVTWVKDGTSYDFYRNGQPFLEDQSAPATFYNSGTDYDIGRVDNYVGGALDDVRIYSRALTAAQVAALYKQGGAKVNSGGGKTITNGLVGWWTFDGGNVNWTSATAGVAYDKSGSNNTGTLTNMSRAFSQTIGKLGQALTFDGSNDYVETVNYSSTITGSFSVCAWVYWYSVSGSQKILHAQNGTPEINLDNYNGGSGNPKIHFYTAASGSSNNVMTSGEDAATSRWYHACGTYDNSSKTKTLYVDSVQKATGGTTVQIAWPSSLLRIGRRLDDTEPLNGKIDDVRVYNRALSASEVKQIYNEGAGTKANASSQTLGAGGLASGLVGHWTFDGKNMYQNVADVSGQGNTGYLAGFTSTTTVIGKLGQAIKFDGSNDYMDAGNASNLNLGTGSATISLWFYMPTTDGVTGAAGYRSLISKRSSSDYTGWAIYRIANSNNINSEWASAHGGPYFNPSSAGAATPNKWNHVTVVLNRGDNTLQMYINASSTGATTDISSLGSVTNNGLNLFVGKEGGISNWNGLTDDVRVYNRALSASEVKQLYNLGK